MVSRNLLIICSLALFAVTVSARSVELVENVEDYEVDFGSDEEEDRGLKDWLKDLAKEAGKEIAQAALKVLKNEISQIKPECAAKIYAICDINPILHPKKFYKCGKAYYKEHKAECRKDKEAKKDEGSNEDSDDDDSSDEQ